jgi:hypothetical protein
MGDERPAMPPAYDLCERHVARSGRAALERPWLGPASYEPKVAAGVGSTTGSFPLPLP